MSTKPTSVVLPDELRAGLKRVFERDGVPQSEQIRRAVRQWLEQRDALPQKRAARSVKRKH